MTTDKQNKVLNVPNLRFPEFTGEWQQYKVCDVLDFYSTNSLSWEQLDFETDRLLNLHYGLIHVGLPTLVDLKTELLPGIKEGNVPKNYELCKSGDVAFADASEDTNDVAKAVELIDINEKSVVCGLHTIHGRDNKGLTVIGYKGCAFASPAFHNQIRRIAQGTKIFSINSKNFSECTIGIPTKAEQKKIVKLLSLIDERIATQSRIIDKLQSLMSGIGERLLYSETGENVKLGDIMSERVEKTTENNQYEILSSTVKGIFLQRDYFSKDIASENNIGYKVVRLNDIVLSPQNLWMGNINYNAKFQIGAVSPSYKIFTVAERFYKPFITAILKTHRALYNYELVSEQGASIVRRNLNMEAFEQLTFKIPSYDRQVQIGNAISTLQQRIDLTKNSYSALIQQKQWLLQRMFI